MPGRNANPGSYRHGFNGMEKDDEIIGTGNSYDFGARIYDSRLGRWLSLDPEMALCPFESHYTFVSNSPNIYIDPTGKTKYFVHRISDKRTGKSIELKVPISDELMRKSIRVNNTLDKHDYHWESAWYDINVVQTIVINENGEINVTNSIEKGKLRTTTSFNWGEAYANFTMKKSDIRWGGVAWTTSSNGSLFGQGSKKKKATDDVEAEDIDVLLDVVSGFSSALNMGAGSFNIPKGFMGANGVLESLQTLATTFSAQSERFVQYKALVDQIKSYTKPKLTCSYCTDTFSIDKKENHFGKIDTVGFEVKKSQAGEGQANGSKTE